MILSWLKGNISPVDKEKKIYRDHFIGGSWQYYQRQGINYIKERGDVQKSADITIKDGGGDCEDIARLFQIDYFWKGKESFLVSLWGIDIFNNNIGHAFCVAREKKSYIIKDYNDVITSNNFNNAIEQIRFKYKVNQIKGIVIQDINWKIVKEI